MKIRKLLVIAGLSALPALALAQTNPGAPADPPKAKAGAGATLKSDTGSPKQSEPALDTGAGATRGAGGETGAPKGAREPGAPTSAPGDRTKGEAR